MRKDLHEDNRRAWNEATRAHNSHKQDQAGFLRSGGNTLFPEELELLGDLHALELLHLQCNAGQDTLSLAQRGAIVTGVDISDEAVAFARQLATDSRIPATFHRADIYDWLAETAQSKQRFDVVFSSYGALVWLSDIATWARGIAAVLRPGGRFAIVEFHPFLYMLDEQWQFALPYFGRGQASTWEHGIGDYVAMSGEVLAPSGYLEGVRDFENPYPSHEFQWTISEIVSALLDAGLQLTALREYLYTNGAKLLPNMRELPNGRMLPPEGVPDLPMMFGLAAQKP